MTAPETFFQITEPPFAVFPGEPPEAVQAAYDWMFTENNIAWLEQFQPRPGQHAQEFLDGFTAVMRRVADDPIVAWLALAQISSLIAEHVGWSEDGFWELPDDVLPTPDDLDKAAGELMPTAERQAGPGAFDRETLSAIVLGTVRAMAEDVLNDVCRGTRPQPLRDLGVRDRLWALKALQAVLVHLRIHDRNIMGVVGIRPNYGYYPDPGDDDE